MNQSLRSIASWITLLLMVIQFIPLQRINPPANPTMLAPEYVKKSLKKACYDCHSYETRWPRIAYIAPLSWIVYSSVISGRNVLNFSTWNKKNHAETIRQAEQIRRVLSKNTNHQRIYYTLQPKMQLTQQEKSAILNWMNNSFAAQ
ncbi:MAG: heme-binding domain-containing protein [Chlorobiaceae bacterium]